MEKISYYVVMVISVLVAGFAQVLLKKSARKTYERRIMEYLNLDVILGYGLLVISTILTIIAFKGLNYTNGSILESFGYLLVMILGKLFFDEKITKWKIIGNITIFLGIVIFYI